uniref:Translocator protein n=1 Tax=Lygus hesperus TaxID=30085 RepID=A0A0A9YD94_LYGHE
MLKISPIIDFAAVAATMSPNTGYLIVDKLATTVDGFYYNHWSQPPWINEARDKFVVFILLLANFMQGYASYIVWRDRGGFQNATVPFAAYTSQIMLFWVHCVAFLRFQSIIWSLVAIILTFIAASGTAFLFFLISPQAGQLMVPYLAWLLHELFRDSWRYTNIQLGLRSYPSDGRSSRDMRDGQSASNTKIKRRPTGYPKGKAAKASGKTEDAPQKGTSKKLVAEKEPSLPFVQDVNTTKHPALQKGETAPKPEVSGGDRSKMGYNPKTAPKRLVEEDSSKKQIMRFPPEFQDAKQNHKGQTEGDSRKRPPA